MDTTEKVIVTVVLAVVAIGFTVAYRKAQPAAEVVAERLSNLEARCKTGDKTACAYLRTTSR